jgi:hypothetical protein
MELDYTQIIIGLIVVFLPSILRELRSFYLDWKMQQPDKAFRLEQAAAFGVKVAAVWRKNNDKSGLDAEGHAVKAAQRLLEQAGIKIDVALVFDAVKAAYSDYKRYEPYELPETVKE